MVSGYYKAEREGIILVCETADCEDFEHFMHHKEPHVYFVIDADRDSRYPPCPVCGSDNGVYEHARGVLKTVEVLNEDDEGF